MSQVAENSGFVLTDDIFAVIKERPESLEAFASAYGIEVDVMSGAFDSRVKLEAEAAKMAERNERISAKGTTWNNEYGERFSGYTLPDSLISLVSDGVQLAKALSDEDSEVSVTFSISMDSDGNVSLGHSVTGTSADKPKSKGGSRKSYSYSIDGEPISGHLKTFIFEKFPDSDAARDMAQFSDELSVKYGVERKKGSRSSWEAVQDDSALSGRITRTERDRDNG